METTRQQQLIFEYQMLFFAAYGYESNAADLTTLTIEELEEAVQQLQDLIR